MFEFTIDRKRWLRGEGSRVSRLLRPSDGKMCCVGFFMKACGHTDEQINDHGALHTVLRTTKDAPLDAFPKLTTAVLVNLYAANDHQMPDDQYSWANHYHPEEREKEITRLFRKAGITVTFTNRR